MSPYVGNTRNGVRRIVENSISVDLNDIVDGDIETIRRDGDDLGHVGFVKDIVRDDGGNVTGYTMLHSEGSWVSKDGKFSGGGDINETKITVDGKRGYSREQFNHSFYKWDTQEGGEIDEVTVTAEGNDKIEPIEIDKVETNLSFE